MLKIVLLTKEVEVDNSGLHRIHQALIDAMEQGLTLRELVHKLNFRSPAPLIACLRRLENRGKLILLEEQSSTATS